jgi:excisionase family DNA binding protein
MKTNGAITRHSPIESLPELLRPEEAAAWADCSRGVIYELARTNRLASVRIGRLLRIPRSALEAWVRGAAKRDNHVS